MLCYEHPIAGNGGQAEAKILIASPFSPSIQMDYPASADVSQMNWNVAYEADGYTPVSRLTAAIWMLVLCTMGLVYGLVKLARQA